MKILKQIAKYILILLILVNLFIIVSGKTYLYKGFVNTYMVGRSGPNIFEFQIFENREVKAGIFQPWKISKKYNSQKVSESNLKNFSQLETVAFVVVKNDSLLHEQYWDGCNADSYTNSFSMAKTFVSILIGIAIDEGKIKSVDQPISDFLPEFKEGDKAKITIKHLLTMSSGLDFDEHYANPFSYTAAAYYGNDLQKLTYSYPSVNEPGKVFLYLSGNTQLLGFVLEKATGQRLSDFASEKLWKPIGAKNSAFWSLDSKDGVEKAYCCFNSNAPDFARIGKLFLDSGKWNGTPIISEDYVVNSIKPANLVDVKGNKNCHYGYCWWIIPDYKGHYIFAARGLLGQYIICIPDKKMVVVRLGNKKEKKVEGEVAPKDFFYYLDAALEMYGN